jgi:SSS family solute:Na+ symporter
MLSQLDLWIVAVYAVALFGLAQWVSREKSGHHKDSNDYFLAGNSLPWWAIGASLIAANISAEQIIGMSGSGYAVGLAIASYEWMAAITLILVGKYLLPVFLHAKIYTMPQFLEQRFDHRVRMVMGTFWLGVYVFVNLTAILWLGALAINTMTGLDIVHGMLLLGLFSIAYSLYGGLKAVAFTDIIQVVLLVAGGLLIVYMTLNVVSDNAGVWEGFKLVTERAPEKFDMILSKESPHYMSLPGLSVLVGGMWVMNLSYWGFNQYIIQRALAAKSVGEAQKGIVFAAFLKILMPVIVVLPGIAMFAINSDLSSPDQAYPTAMALLPSGIKGVVFAALLAAIVSSLASMVNSISTIFTMDIYPSLVKQNRAEPIVVGRVAAFVAMALALITAKPLLGNFDQAFQYIQEFTGFFTPGIVVIFLLGIFYKKTSADGALAAAIGSAVFSLAGKLLFPALPFIDRVGLVFLLCAGLALLVSHYKPQAADSGHAVVLGDIDMSTSTSFNAATVAVVLILCALYITWW